MRHADWRIPCLALLLAVLPVIAAAEMNVEKTDEGYRVSENGQPVLFYQVAPKSLNGQYTRDDYVHPLYGLNGEVLTEDFPEDHLHHRGIFWTWHQVMVDGKQMGDAWECRDFIWDITGVTPIMDDATGAGLHATVLWKSPDYQNGQSAFVREETTILASPRRNNTRTIDFTIALTPLVDHFALGGSDDVKGYGGFTARVASEANAQFDGATAPGQVPLNHPVFAGPWLNVHGTFEAKPYGIAILQDPRNPNFPQPWILRHDYEKTNMQNPVFPWRLPVPIAKEQTITLRYRMLLHDGTADIERAYADYYQARAAKP